MQMRNSCCHCQWWQQQHPQIKNCLSSLVVFGTHIDELWMRQILCSGPRRLWNNLDTATCWNLDIAGSVYNLLTCHSCTTLCKCQKEFHENTDVCVCSRPLLCLFTTTTIILPCISYHYCGFEVAAVTTTSFTMSAVQNTSAFQLEWDEECTVYQPIPY